MRVLVDTNIHLSAILAPPDKDTPIVQSLALANEERIVLLVAEETVMEFRSTISTKTWFVRTVTTTASDRFIARPTETAALLPALAYPPPHRCRDRRDDYLLEQAVRFEADVLLTGDDDLLSIEEPPPGLRILDARAFVDEFSEPE